MTDDPITRADPRQRAITDQMTTRNEDTMPVIEPSHNDSTTTELDAVRAERDDWKAERDRYREALQRIAAPDSTFWEANMARRMAAIARAALNAS